MKKKWNLLALLLALAMCLSLLGGCGSGSTPANSTGEDETAAPAAESVSAPESTAAADAAEMESAAETDADEEAEPAEPESYQPLMTDETAALIEELAAAARAVPSEEFPEEQKSELWKYVESDEYQAKLKELREYVDTVLPGSEPNYDAQGNLLSVQDVPYAYPLDDGHSLTVFAPIRGFISRAITDYGEIPAFKVAASETNVDVEFLTISEDAAETQMSLMFASGDYTDLVADFLYSYVGTTMSAYDSDLIVPLNDYLEDYSPNYYAWLNSRPDYLKTVSEDDGLIFAWYNLMPEVRLESTSWVRTDLLDKFQMDSPITLDDYEEYFTQCVNDGLTATIYADSTSWASIAASAFDIPGLNGPEGFSLAAYHVGDKVYSAYQSDQAREYVELMRRWYEKGFFSQDLVSVNGAALDRRMQDQLVVTGEVGYMVQGVDRYTNYLESATVENWDIEPARNPVKEDGQVTHFEPNDPIAESNGSIVITSACEDIEGACRYVDWFYTDMGINTMNYGPQGVTWDWSSDGLTRLFTNAIYEDQIYNENAGSAVMFYTGYVAWTSVTDPYLGMYFSQTDKGIEAIEECRINNDSEYYLNEALISFSTEETDVINSKLADMTTYIAENLVKFLIGDTPMSEWDSFLDALDQMGLEDVVDVYQSAYDRYLSN